MKKEIIILNLCEELNPQLRNYFNQREIRLIDPKVDEKNYKWTHILTQNLQDFSFIRESYKTIENNIQIISLTPVHQKQDFICANGKIILNEFWIKSKIRYFILDKFFQEYLSTDITLSEVHFGTLGKFNLHQFHILGDSFDQVVAAAHEDSVSSVNVRSFLDHTLMYLAALRNRRKMEFPLEIVYGTSEDAFGVQFYFPSQGLMIEDVSSSFGMEGNRHSEESLLTTAFNRCDFLDFSLISSAKKMVITAAWVKGGGVSDASLLLTTLPHKAKLVGYLQEENIDSGAVKVTDYLEHIHLPKIQNEEARRVSGENFSEIIATRISDVLELERIQRIAGTEESEEELVQVLKESAQEENDKIVFGSQHEFDDVKQIISSSLHATSENIQKDFISSNDLHQTIIKSLAEERPEIFRVKSFKEKVSQEIHHAMDNFCEEKNFSSQDFSREHITEFQTYFLNKNLKDNSIILGSNAKKLVSDLRQRLQTSLAQEFQEESVENVFEKASEHDFDKKRIRNVFKNNLKESLEATFGFEGKRLIKKDEEDAIARALGATANEREVIKELVQDETAVSPHEPLFLDHVSEKEKALLIQVESLSQDNQSLRDKLQATLLEVRVLKDAKNTVTRINEEANDVSKSSVAEDGIFEASMALKQELKSNLERGNLQEADKRKIAELLEREVQLMTTYNEDLMKNKKMQIESSQKESLYISELEKLKRHLKARDLMIAKSKESLQKLAERKDFEINDLQAKLSKSNVLLGQNENSNASLENRHLQMQNLNLGKQLEVYKIKLSSLSENLKNKDKAENSKDELRKAQMEKNQLRAQLMQTQREFSRLEAKTKFESERSQSLQVEVQRLQEELSNRVKELKASAATQLATEKNSTEGPVAEMQLAHVKELESKIVQLESKLVEALKNQKSNNTDDKKMMHLEASVKKLTQDIAEARNVSNELKKEGNKLRQEKTALQNQIERMKKEAQKNKKSA